MMAARAVGGRDSGDVGGDAGHGSREDNGGGDASG